MKIHNEKKKITIINTIFLLISLFIIFGFCIAIAIRGQKNESIIENRKLVKAPKFNFTSFLNGKYQDQLENSLTDQMILGQRIKQIMTSSKSEMIVNLQTKLTAKLEDTESNENIKYIPIAGTDVYYYGDSQYMVFKSLNLDENKEKINTIARSYQNHFKGIDSYFYLVNTSKSTDFNTVNENENEFLTYIKKAFSNFKCDGLKISSYNQYKDYFYETDHHWNYKGSYQGYKDIINLLLPGEEIIKPTETKTFDTYYYGSNARTTSIFTNKEKFTVYNFDIPKNTVYINGSKSTYGNKDMYYENRYSKEKGYNHYAAFYGSDYAEVIFDFNQPKKENLLVIAPSYSNAINELLASHFNKTYYIDLRHYEAKYGEPFNPEEYCKKNNIDKFLLLISIDHLTNGKFELDK